MRLRGDGLLGRVGSRSALAVRRTLTCHTGKHGVESEPAKALVGPLAEPLPFCGPFRELGDACPRDLKHGAAPDRRCRHTPQAGGAVEAVDHYALLQSLEVAAFVLHNRYLRAPEQRAQNGIVEHRAPAQMFVPDKQIGRQREQCLVGDLRGRCVARPRELHHLDRRACAPNAQPPAPFEDGRKLLPELLQVLR